MFVILKSFTYLCGTKQNHTNETTIKKTNRHPIDHRINFIFNSIDHRINFIIHSHQKVTMMKTILPTGITTIEEAKRLLTDLLNNGESFHPEDDASDLVGDPFTAEEATQLNKLMEDIYNLKGNESHHKMIFDPCGFLLELDPGYLTMRNADDLQDILAQESVPDVASCIENMSYANLMGIIKLLDDSFIVNQPDIIAHYGQPATDELKAIFWKAYKNRAC